MAFSCICPPFSAYLYKAEGLCLHKLVVKLFTWGNRRLTCINHLFPLPRMSDIRESKHWQDNHPAWAPSRRTLKHEYHSRKETASPQPPCQLYHLRGFTLFTPLTPPRSPCSPASLFLKPSYRQKYAYAFFFIRFIKLWVCLILLSKPQSVWKQIHMYSFIFTPPIIHQWIQKQS